MRRYEFMSGGELPHGWCECGRCDGPAVVASRVYGGRCCDRAMAWPGSGDRVVCVSSYYVGSKCRS